jgi:hypothetical protein
MCFSLTASLCAWGTARVELSDIASLRKRLPAWVPPDTPGHFLKYADEQTVVAIAAVDRAIQSHALNLAESRDWAIVAAPRFIGRMSGPTILDRFIRGGSQGVSPHVIPQHSLHSVSGALAILLASHGPNVGVGGGPDSLDNAFLTALSLPSACRSQGAWIVATAFDPEPAFGAEGRLLNAPACHAVALAIDAQAAAESCGSLVLTMTGCEGAHALSVRQLARDLEYVAASSVERAFAWQLSWEATLELRVKPAQARFLAAA